VRDFDLSHAYGAAVFYRQNVGVGQAKYSYFTGPWLNEAKVDFSRFQRNPSPQYPGTPARNFQYANADHFIGSNRSTQDFVQNRLGLRAGSNRDQQSRSRCCGRNPAFHVVFLPACAS